MQFYSMAFEAVLTLTPKRFWFLLNQIDRLRAEEQMLHLHILAASGTGDGCKAALEGLTKQMGQVYVWEPKIPVEFKVDPVTGLDPEFDREGLRALKARHSSPAT